MLAPGNTGVVARWVISLHVIALLEAHLYVVNDIALFGLATRDIPSKSGRYGRAVFKTG